MVNDSMTWLYVGFKVNRVCTMWLSIIFKCKYVLSWCIFCSQSTVPFPRNALFKCYKSGQYKIQIENEIAFLAAIIHKIYHHFVVNF